MTVALKFTVGFSAGVLVLFVNFVGSGLLTSKPKPAFDGILGGVDGTVKVNLTKVYWVFSEWIFCVGALILLGSGNPWVGIINPRRGKPGFRRLIGVV